MTFACVATAPTPANAHGTTSPTLKYFDSTATPSVCVVESYATIENVFGPCQAWAAVDVSARNVMARAIGLAMGRRGRNGLGWVMNMLRRAWEGRAPPI